MPKKKNYELKIGYANNKVFHGDKGVVFVHRKIITSPSLSAAKSKATVILKKLPDMERYIKTKFSEVRWRGWSKSIEYEPGRFFANKQSDGIDLPSFRLHSDLDKIDEEHPGTYGFVQLAWDELQEEFDF